MSEPSEMEPNLVELLQPDVPQNLDQQNQTKYNDIIVINNKYNYHINTTNLLKTGEMNYTFHVSI